MPYRWCCCKCDNGWMLVKQGATNVCTWTECQHVKCGGCDDKMMAARMDMEAEAEAEADPGVVGMGGSGATTIELVLERRGCSKHTHLCGVAGASRFHDHQQSPPDDGGSSSRDDDAGSDSEDEGWLSP